MKKTLFAVFILLGLGVTLLSCNSSEKETTDTTNKPLNEDKSLLEQALQIFSGPLPEMAMEDTYKLTDEKIVLGKTLFYDNRLSLNNTQSCNTCHDLKKYGVDNEATSAGDLGKLGGRNSPTVYNAAFHFAQFWDGRAKDVEEQAGGPVLNPVEMNMPSEKKVVNRLQKINGYQDLFKKAFPEAKNAVTYRNMQEAIGAFERTLVTKNSKFDQFLNGNLNALNPEEKEGLKTFMDAGCIACHSGKTLGGQMYQKFPVFGTSYMEKTHSKKEDLGRMEVTHSEADKGMFKVPSLLNITETAPYFHDGSVANLNEAIQVMAELQTGKTLNDKEVQSIATFLKTLKGELPKEALILPTMPK